MINKQQQVTQSLESIVGDLEKRNDGVSINQEIGLNLQKNIVVLSGSQIGI